MTVRKTVHVVDILESANFYLRNSPPKEQTERKATANFLESILSMANAYAGYGFFASDESGESDDTRRLYYRHHSL